MFREGKLIYQMSNIAADYRHVYLGFQGTHSSIAVIRQEDMTFLGAFTSMCGSPRGMKILTEKEKLVCYTTAGYIYVWDIAQETINALERITLDPLTINGFVHPDSRIRPVIAVTPKSSSDTVALDTVPNSNIIVAVSYTGVISFYDIRNGSKRGMFNNFVERGRYVNCVKVDQQLTTLKEKQGYWLTVAGSVGFIGNLFLEVDLLEKEVEETTDVTSDDSYSMTHSIGSREIINCIDFRSRSVNSLNIILLAGCSDGAVRCVVFKLTEEQLQPHKTVAYHHCIATKYASVNKVISERSTKGKPNLLSLCNMSLPYDVNNTVDIDVKNTITEASSFCSEIHIQELLNDKTGSYEVTARLRDYIVDMYLSYDQSYLLFCTMDDCYLIRRNESDNTSERPMKLEWNTQENQKLMAKIL